MLHLLPFWANSCGDSNSFSFMYFPPANSPHHKNPDGWCFYSRSCLFLLSFFTSMPSMGFGKPSVLLEKSAFLRLNCQVFGLKGKYHAICMRLPHRFRWWLWWDRDRSARPACWSGPLPPMLTSPWMLLPMRTCLLPNLHRPAPDQVRHIAARAGRISFPGRWFGFVAKMMASLSKMKKNLHSTAAQKRFMAW